MTTVEEIIERAGGPRQINNALGLAAGAYQWARRGIPPARFGFFLRCVEGLSLDELEAANAALRSPAVISTVEDPR